MRLRTEQKMYSRVIDPFYVYLELVQVLGKGHVFLLDAARDREDSNYQMSMLGACPLLEVQVKDGRTVVHALSGLATFLSVHLSESGMNIHPVEKANTYPSVVEGTCFEVHGANPMAILEHLRLALRTLCSQEELPPFSNGFLGYIGYDAVHYLETLPKTTLDDRDLPDVRLQWHGTLLQIIDNSVKCYDVTPNLTGLLSPTEMTSLVEDARQIFAILDTLHQNGEVCPQLLRASLEHEIPDIQICEDVLQAEFEERVGKAQEYIQSGDIFQVVLSKRIRINRALHPYVAYDQLRTLNPSPYMFMAEFPDMRLFGASPEVQFRAVGGEAEMKPIAGTSKGRGRTPEEDERLGQRLLADEKERAEHVMLVDLCRNDLGRVCKIGSVHVPKFMVIEPYSHLFHLVSLVKGTLKADVNVFDALLATFPAGTLSGAPKIRAMEIIDELEQIRRGPYGGMVGMIDLNANANTAIVIRTVVDTKDSYYVQVGAGIVADSIPEQEWLECGHKAGAVIDVLSGRSLTRQ